MLKPKIKIILFKGKTLSDCKRPVMLQVKDGDDYKRISLGISSLEKEWNSTDARFKDNRTENRDIMEYEEQANEILSDMFKQMRHDRKEFSYLDFKQRFIGKKQDSDIPITLLGFLEWYMKELEDVERYGDLAHYKKLYNALGKYGIKDSLNLHDIDKAWLVRFEKHLSQQTNRRTGQMVKKISVKDYTKHLRTLFNKAIYHEVTTHYPFKNSANPTGYSFSHLVSPRISKSAGDDDIDKFLAYDIKIGSWKARRAWRTCIFIWAFRGIPISDAARLSKSDISNEEVVFARIKTRKKVPNIPLTPDRKEILISLEADTDGYHLLPILHQDRHITEKQKRSRIRTINGIVNDGLKEIMLLQDIKTNLSTYVFRHTFSRRVLEKYGIWTLKETLAHKSVETTQFYATSLSSKEIEKVDSVL